MTRPDPAPGFAVLLAAAEQIERTHGTEATAARNVLARTARHKRTCERCASFDPTDLVDQAVFVMDTLEVDAEFDAAVIELAHELKLTGSWCGASQ